MEIILSTHTKEMLRERNILEEWIWQTVNAPERVDSGADNNVHYFRRIAENQERVLHVVVNPHISPKKIVTAFFDRRAGREK